MSARRFKPVPDRPGVQESILLTGMVKILFLGIVICKALLSLDFTKRRGASLFSSIACLL